MPNNINIQIEQPNTKQAAFFTADSRFIAYGGARGGGKSWAVRRKALLLSLNYPGIKILLLRRTYPELRENHVLPLISELHGLADYKDADKSFIFLNGSRIKLGYCDSENDVLQYQGQEYDIIFIDEATQFSEYQFQTLTACLRGANAFPKRMYLTCNPGGRGHAWVKRLFIDKAYIGSENPADYTFIPARVYDNPALLEHDKGYVQMLENLPHGLREAWLNGSWDVFAGQYFTMFNRDVHVINPFAVPSSWQRYVAFDYGRDMLAAYLFAVDFNNNAYIIRELYEGRDNNMGENGQGHIVSAAAKRIKEVMGDNIDTYFAPPDLWNKHADTGKSTAEIFAEFGIPLVKTSNDRVQGWRDMAEWLKVIEDEQGQPSSRLKIFASCLNLIRCLPLVQYDEKKPDDISKDPHELTHSVDAVRYFCAGRPAGKEITVNSDDEDFPDYDLQVNDFLYYSV